MRQSIFLLGIFVMFIIMTIGSIQILTDQARMFSRVDTENCFLHRHMDETC